MKPGYHAHRCSGCGNIWCHAENSDYNSHKCSECGKFQFWKYQAVGYTAPPETPFSIIMVGKDPSFHTPNRKIPGYGRNVPSCLRG